MKPNFRALPVRAAMAALLLLTAAPTTAKPAHNNGAKRASAAAATDAAMTTSSRSNPSAALLTAVRSDLKAAARGGDGKFANLLVTAVVEGAFTSLLHATYALSSTGQALRGGTAPAAEAAVFARDVGRNLGALALTWTALAKERAFAGPPAAVFSSLATQAGRGEQAAKSLEDWAKTPTATTRMGAFERDIGILRDGVAEVATALRGPEPEPAGPQAKPGPPLPAP